MHLMGVVRTRGTERALPGRILGRGMTAPYLAGFSGAQAEQRVQTVPTRADAGACGVQNNSNESRDEGWQTIGAGIRHK